MVTFFAVPKAFAGHTGMIQRNAIGSWANMPCPHEILLYGDDDGVAEAARDFGAIHVPDIQRSSLGTPILSSIFSDAAARARFPLLCYVNADIILLPDFADVLQQLPPERFLLTGQHVDVDIGGPLVFSDPDWSVRVRRHATETGVLHSVWGMDYFVFPRGSISDMPAFCVGRAGWDSWMVYRALRAGYRVIDGTARILAIHQNHDYGHVPASTGARWEGPETDQNRRLMPPHAIEFSIADATHYLSPKGMVPRTGGQVIRNRLERLPFLYPAAPWATRAAWRLMAAALGATGKLRRYAFRCCSRELRPPRRPAA